MNREHILQVVLKESLTIVGWLPKVYRCEAFGTLGRSSADGTKVDCGL